jgi:hypothetical protein
MNLIYIHTHMHIYGTLQDSLLFWLFVCNYNQVAFTIWDPSRLKVVCLFVCNCYQVAFYYDDCMGSMFSHVVHVATHQRPRSIKFFKSMIQVKWKERKGSNKPIWRKCPPSLLLLGPLKVTPFFFFVKHVLIESYLSIP